MTAQEGPIPSRRHDQSCPLAKTSHKTFHVPAEAPDSLLSLVTLALQNFSIRLPLSPVAGRVQPPYYCQPKYTSFKDIRRPAKCVLLSTGAPTLPTVSP